MNTNSTRAWLISLMLVVVIVRVLETPSHLSEREEDLARASSRLDGKKRRRRRRRERGVGVDETSDDDDDDDDDVRDAVLLVAIVVVSGTVGNDAHPQKEDCIGDDDDDHESTSPRFAVARLAAPSIARRIVLWVAQK